VSESGEDISKTVDSMSINGDRVGQLNISRTAVNVGQGGTEFGTPTGFTCKMRKWNWLFVNIYECDSLTYRYGNFKLLAKWGKCINVLGSCVVK
jgi:hypothetical protein